MIGHKSIIALKLIEYVSVRNGSDIVNMELLELLSKVKENIADFIERYDDFFFDINPCEVCHEDLHICPNPKCRAENEICAICKDTRSICENCDKEIFTKYEEYFMLVNGIAANPGAFTTDEVANLLDAAIAKINKN